jgi:hypothetical protein
LLNQTARTATDPPGESRADFSLPAHHAAQGTHAHLKKPSARKNIFGYVIF